MSPRLSVLRLFDQLRRATELAASLSSCAACNLRARHQLSMHVHMKQNKPRETHE